jgi:hypothetical protein
MRLRNSARATVFAERGASTTFNLKIDMNYYCVGARFFSCSLEELGFR